MHELVNTFDEHYQQKLPSMAELLSVGIWLFSDEVKASFYYEPQKGTWAIQT